MRTNSRVLLVRLEDLDRVAQPAFAEFLGADVGHVVQRNEASDKVYADVYRRFMGLLKMPRQYLDRMYSSRYSRHFYTEREIAKFRSSWVQRLFAWLACEIVCLASSDFDFLSVAAL